MLFCKLMSVYMCIRCVRISLVAVRGRVNGYKLVR